MNMGKSKPEQDINYPGKGVAWSDFLHYRAILLHEWMSEGKSSAECARVLAMDPNQAGEIVAATPELSPTRKKALRK